MIKRRIAELLTTAINEAQSRRALPAMSIPDLGIDHPPQRELGDYASSVAMRIARAARMNPRDIAATIASLIPPSREIARVETAPPGFINLYLDDSWVAEQVETILREGIGYGSGVLPGKRIQVEYVSANPTGPLHAGHGRGAVFGDTLANILAFAGHDVQREYYVNDAGAQVRLFGATLLARYQQALGHDVPLPADGYAGAYMQTLAAEIVEEYGDRFLALPQDEAQQELASIGMEKVLAWIRGDLHDLRIHFDRWFHERELFEDGQLQEALAKLREAGVLDEREGALWFASTALGEDKDNVIIRSNGIPTYFATDIAYHYDKFLRRKFDEVIDVWGADHHGHVSRMKAVVSALGIDPDRLVVALSQLVTLKRGGEVVRLSKRTGDIVTLREVIDEVGADACRFFFIQRSPDSQMDFDLELAKEQSDKNPVYYVQYAHARIASILRLAEERAIDWSAGEVALLRSEAEQNLIRKLITFPEVIETAALNRAPQGLPAYALALAGEFHSFYRVCRVVSDDAALSAARLKLVASVKTVLANALRLMGMTAPDRMVRTDE
ncbi:MAG: arginine--tRNA ligase [Dehalococcoidia bacterium]|nr:MAG: arginine--tRNA ligase [Dehalococcoidia bacterium]